MTGRHHDQADHEDEAGGNGGSAADMIDHVDDYSLAFLTQIRDQEEWGTLETWCR